MSQLFAMMRMTFGLGQLAQRHDQGFLEHGATLAGQPGVKWAQYKMGS